MTAPPPPPRTPGIGLPETRGTGKPSLLERLKAWIKQ